MKRSRSDSAARAADTSSSAADMAMQAADLAMKAADMATRAAKIAESGANPAPPGEIADAVIVYTDGGCDPNPGTGGWAAVLIYKGVAKELSGGEHNTTNNRMEMTAALRALEALKRPCKVTLHTDSQYLQKGITEWLPGWKARGWKRREGAVKNEDLWRELDALCQRHRVIWKWVRGHVGNRYNERCDELASAAIAAMKNPRRLGASGRVCNSNGDGR